MVKMKMSVGFWVYCIGKVERASHFGSETPLCGCGAICEALQAVFTAKVKG